MIASSQPVAGSPRSPLPALLLILSGATGLVDAIGVLGLGKVFTANMTGNIVFLGFAVARTPNFHAISYLVAISMFLLGALAAGRTSRAYAGRALGPWMIASALAEAGLLWAAAFVAIGFDIALQSPNWRLYSIIALTAAAMGFRNATVRQLKVPDLTTTVLTMTLTGLAADSSLAGGANPNWLRRTSGVLAIFLGATVGALLVARYGMSVPLAVAGFLVLAGTALCARHPFARMPLG
jgi:uncharacterized membrane protein YoaK (UPF0700 family)